MKKLHLFSAIALVSVVSTASAANAPVNIVYPIDGNAYNNYFTSSFGATCGGGQYSAVWGFDSTTVGNGTYYDQISVQFSHKLPSGTHTFWVKTSCGYDVVKFKVL